MRDICTKTAVVSHLKRSRLEIRKNVTVGVAVNLRMRAKYKDSKHQFFRTSGAQLGLEEMTGPQQL